MRLLIGGDLVPTQSNVSLFNQADTISLLGDELHSIWNSVDMRIFNLEVPLVDNESPIDKCGPNLIAPKSTVSGIKALKPSLITLANNHILDQGEQGLKSTMEVLDNNNIPFVGAGSNLFEANKPNIINKGGVEIGVYACAEHEFTIATESTPGANPFDPLESLDHIKNLSEKSDYVIVLYHGGKEHYRYPSPYLQKVCRKIVEKGADLVICQHSHCVGCYENYLGSRIIYGQGNFIFDRFDNEFWKTSLLIELEISDHLDVKYIPLVKKGNVVRLANDEESNNILNSFYKRSDNICHTGFIEEQYQKLAFETISSYLRTFSGFGKWVSRFDRKVFKGLILRNRYSKSKRLAIQNYIECEAHRELMLQGIKGEIESGR